jgi:hypothetical protein
MASLILPIPVPYSSAILRTRVNAPFFGRQPSKTFYEKAIHDISLRG